MTRLETRQIVAQRLIVNRAATRKSSGWRQKKENV